MSPAEDTATRKGIVFRSVDSQPEGLSVRVSTLRAPALLITFAILSVLQLWLFQTGAYDWVFPQRDYVFAPYTMVNDHRTEVKVTDVQSVMDGDLEPFIKAYLLQEGLGQD